MMLRTIGRLAGAVALTVGLAGCFDVVSEVEVLSETDGKVTTTMTFGPDVWPMLKMMAMQGATAEGTAEGATEAPADPTAALAELCPDGGKMVENADGSAVCTQVKQGRFEDIVDAADGDDGAKFEVVSPGVVRVSFTTSGLREGMAEGLGPEAGGEEGLAEVRPYFENKAITLRIKGKSIGDTNMTRTADGTGVELVIPWVDLLDKKVDLPPELYAVINTR